ncbi:nucleoside triphosphate pyrophosphohydrolase family protein [Saccharopolyspora taberi]|uniref:Nucleoside triphosphate pyrophosphohydrolase family protein n=1 Tax=Saccharopolyspora taberi TaxID=60895 RepID=A0ABN3VAA0_9PSEU
MAGEQAPATSWEQFHAATAITARFTGWPASQVLLYAALGLTNEAGEVAGEIKKAVRDDGGEITEQRREAVIDELGDVLWYAARLAESVDATLEDAARANIAKVRRRLANGTLSGSGER